MKTRPGKTAAPPRRTRRPVERPGELLVAAIDVFELHGYETSSLDDVARAAGVTKGAIYTHFESKADLLRQAITHRLRENFALVESLLAEEREKSPEERLELVLRFAWDRWSSPEFARFVGLLAEVRRVVPDAVARWVDEGPVTGWSIVSRIIADGQRSGDFDAELDADAAARLVLSGVVFQALSRVGGYEARPRRRGRVGSSPAEVSADSACDVARAMLRRRER